MGTKHQGATREAARRGRGRGRLPAMHKFMSLIGNTHTHTHKLRLRQGLPLWHVLLCNICARHVKPFGLSIAAGKGQRVAGSRCSIPTRITRQSKASPLPPLQLMSASSSSWRHLSYAAHCTSHHCHLGSVALPVASEAAFHACPQQQQHEACHCVAAPDPLLHPTSSQLTQLCSVGVNLIQLKRSVRKTL